VNLYSAFCKKALNSKDSNILLLVLVVQNNVSLAHLSSAKARKSNLPQNPNTLNTFQPSNLLWRFFSYHIVARSVGCSNNTNLLSVPRVHTAFASYVFSVAVLWFWNLLLSSIRVFRHHTLSWFSLYLFFQAFFSLS